MPDSLQRQPIDIIAATAEEIRSGGKGWTIDAGFAGSPFGHCLIAVAPKGIVRLGFPDSRDRAAAEALVAESWPAAKIRWNNAAAKRIADEIFGPGNPAARKRFEVIVAGSEFQMRVWRALARIPSGTVVTYGELARMIGLPRAARAVGNAVGANPVAFLIPCHRVVRAGGDIGKFRWGTTRKRAILERESRGA